MRGLLAARRTHLALLLACLAAGAGWGAPAAGSPRVQALAAPTTVAPQPGERLSTMGPLLVWSAPEGVTQWHLQVTPHNGDGPGIDLHVGSAASSFQVPPPPGWYGLLPDMTYTWRIRVSDAATFVSLSDVSWSPWAESTFRTPVVSADGIRAVEPAQNASIAGVTPTLRWQNSRTDVFYYELQLSKDATFDTDPATATAMVYWVLLHGGVTTPSNSYTVPAAFPLERGTSYAWRLRPRVQGDGTPVAWTPAFQFATGTAPPSATPIPSPVATSTPSPTVTPAQTSTPTSTPTPAPALPYALAFTSRRDGNGEVYVAGKDGVLTNVSSNAADDRNPAWHPGGNRLVFVSLRDGNEELYEAAMATGVVDKITSSSDRDDFPAVSPGGTRIAHVRTRAFSSGGAPDREYIVIGARGEDRSNPHVVGSAGEGAARPVQWYLAEGQVEMLAYVSQGQVNVYDPVSRTGMAAGRNAVAGEGVAVAPGGETAVYAAGEGGQMELHLVDIEENKTRQLTLNYGRDGRPAWSPDGTKIAFESERDGNIEIYVMNADGSGQTNLTRNSAPDYAPVWSPDGKSIAFVTLRDGNSEVYVMDADGRNPRNVSNHPAVDNSPAFPPG